MDTHEQEIQTLDARRAEQRKKGGTPVRYIPAVAPETLQLRRSRLYCWNGRKYEEVSCTERS